MPRLALGFKSSKDVHPDIDPLRALRTIRILGALNLLLVIGLGVSLWWNSRGADALRINTTAPIETDQVTIFMEARLSSAGKPVRSGDTLSDPVLTVHGVLADYGRLREGLNGLSVTVRGTRVDIVPETGEFTERVVLTPGNNQINFGVWWDGREWQRRHVEVIYLKPSVNSTPEEAPTL